MSIEAMKQALEALVGYELVYGSDEKDREAVRALRTAIEAAEKQEPVAWLCERDGRSLKFVYTNEQLHELGYGNISVPPFRKVAPLYTTPQPQREWVGLTDEDEIDWDGGDLKSLVKAIEAKLKEKNT